MKVEVKMIGDKEKEKAVIETSVMTDNIRQAVSLLEEAVPIIGMKNEESYPIESSKIYYIEAIDNKTFIYLKNECYESRYKLYELEEVLGKDRFLRTSKGMILNIRKIKNLKSDINARFIATLLNDENVIISRSYVKDLKKMLGL